jgi:plastocyanin
MKLEKRMERLFITVFRLVIATFYFLAVAASAAVMNVNVVNNSFVPASVTINVNDQVTWVWAAADGATPHTTTSSGGLWDSGLHAEPFSFSHTFPTAGMFPYVCTVHASFGMVGTVIVQGAASTPPSITSQPKSQTVSAGANVTFNVTATGTAPLSFQWQKNGTDVPGSTSASLTLNAVTASDAGSYTVVVTNAAGSVTSDSATLTVNAAGNGPVITSQPTSQTVSSGANVTFTVTATGTAPLSFQWQKNGAAIPGATSASLTLNAVTTSDAGSYTVVVSNGVGSVTSSTATLTVNTAASAPVITSQPVSQTVSNGVNVTFTVTATGTAPLSFQWQKNAAAVPGATSASLTLSAVTAGDAGTYAVVVSNAAGSVTSAQATLTVNTGGNAPVITGQPVSQTVSNGANVTFTVTATGTAPLSFQWQKNGAAIPGATSSSLTLNAVTAIDAGSYTVVVSNAGGPVTSAAATLTINTAVNAPVITSQPVSQTVSNGANVTFTVTATSTAPLSFQWQKNGVAIHDATSASLTLNAVMASAAGNYTVVVSNSAGSVTSAAATLTVNAAGNAPVITSQPTNQTVPAGANVTFTVAATGAAPLRFQWEKNGASIPGATTTSLHLVNVQTNQAGTYSVLVSNLMGTVTSSDAVLSVTQGASNSSVQGSFSGFFFDTNALSVQSAGSFNLTTTSRGTFTGRLRIGLTFLSISGRFDSNGAAQSHVARKQQPPLTVVLQLDANDADHITGTVSDGTFTAELEGNRAVFDVRRNPAPQAGQYTMVIFGTNDSSALPSGDGFATITVDKGGKVRLAASLADGTAISQLIPLSKNGDWLLFVPLYSGQGFILGAMTFESTSTDDLHGNVVWMKPNVPKAKLFPAGFTFTTTASGSQFSRPATGNNILGLTDATVRLTGDSLQQDVVNQISVNASNRVSNLSSNKLTLTFSANGSFTGRVTDPVTMRSISFNGVVIQKEKLGLGWFPGNGDTGEVSIMPPSP